MNGAQAAESIGRQKYISMRPLLDPDVDACAGGMISKAPRLPKQRRATAPPPGSYNPDRCFRYLNDKKDVSRGASFGFAKPIVPDSVKQLRRKGPDGPGPGQYDPGAWQVRKILRPLAGACGYIF